MRKIAFTLILFILVGGSLGAKDYSGLIGTWKITHCIKGKRWVEFITITEVTKQPLGEHEQVMYLYQVKAKISDYVLLRGDIVNGCVMLCESHPQLMVLPPYMVGIYFRIWWFRFAENGKTKKGEYMSMALGENKEYDPTVVVQDWWHKIKAKKLNSP